MGSVMPEVQIFWAVDVDGCIMVLFLIDNMYPWSRISVAQANLGAGGGCSVAQVALLLRLSTLHARAVRWGFARCKKKIECD